MKKTLPLVIGFLAGFVVIARYFSPSEILDSWGSTVVMWRNLVAAFALGLGAVNLVQAHARKLSRRAPNWEASLMLLSSLVLFTVVGIWKGTDSPLYTWGFEYLYQPIYSGISSLLAFMITSASYRAFKVKDWQSAILMATAVIVMLGQVGVGSFLYKGMPALSAWTMAIPNTAGMRGITIGGALGAIALSLRVLLGLERGYMGGDRQ
ncbi:MAG: hypothetical protein ACOX5M_04445 [Bacillota bacterium]